MLEGTGGRLLVFQHMLPALGEMRLAQRDDTRAYGTDKECSLLTPADPSWEALAKAFAKEQICVSSFHFVAASQFVDLPSQAYLARHTGGQVYLYTECLPEQRDLWAAKLEVELGRNLRRTFGFEGVMRVRCSKGLTVGEYLMGTPRPGELEVDVPGIDADAAFAVTLRHDDKLDESQPAYVQCALLYTTGYGQRRVRVLTLALQPTEAMANLYRYADLDAIMNVLMRQCVALAPKKTCTRCASTSSSRPSRCSTRTARCAPPRRPPPGSSSCRSRSSCCRSTRSRSPRTASCAPASRCAPTSARC